MPLKLFKNLFFLKLSLTWQALIVVLLVGTATWGIADYLGRVSVEDAFKAHLRQDLSARAVADRFRFSRYVYGYREAAKVFVSQKDLVSYVDQAVWGTGDTVRAAYHKRSPAWLAKRSLQRALVAPRIALLLDRGGTLREVYHRRQKALPKSLAPPSLRLLRLSENENYLIPFSEGPYLVTTQKIQNRQQQHAGYLVLASPIDQRFLLASQQMPSKGFQVALVTEEAPDSASAISDPLRNTSLRILVSSDMKQLPKGTLVSDLPGHLLFNPQILFEYGSSEMSFRFVTLVSTDLVGPETRKVINRDRFRHALQALLFVIVFALVMVRLTRRIEKLHERVTDFTTRTLGKVPLLQNGPGDQLRALENQFNELTVAVKTRTGELETANSELKDFAYVVSHDLKAPLRSISQLATWLAEDYGVKIGKQGQEQLNLLASRPKRMLSLIDGILQYSRVGRIRRHYETVNLNNLLAEIIDSLSPPENIQVRVSNELPAIVCDKTGMYQVFQNLISNAVKFMDKSHGDIAIAQTDKGHHWQFTITDNGPGIAPKFHDTVFKIFQTIVPRDQRESTGIGLSIVRKVVEAHGGQIWLESEVGRGATFFFTISKRKHNPPEEV